MLGFRLTSCDKAPKVSFKDEVIGLKVGETKEVNIEVTKGKEVEFSLSNETTAKIAGNKLTGVSAAHGGNRNSIGIEMNVNTRAISLIRQSDS